MSCPICGESSINDQMCGSDECVDFIWKCIDDPIFFFENALIIRYIKGVPQFFDFEHPDWKDNPWQKEFLLHVKECLDNGEPIRIIVQKGRRIGFSLLMAGFHIWYITCRAAYDGEDKYWDIISASHEQAKKLFRTGKKMIQWNPLLMNAIKIERNGVIKLGEMYAHFVNDDDTIEGIVTALSSGGATKRGRDPSGQTFDEAAQISDEDYNDLDISSMAGDDHQIIGSTPYDDFGFFHHILNPEVEDDEDDEDDLPFKKMYVPTAVLTPEGQKLLDDGDMRKIKVEHIKSVIGYRITKRKIINRLRRYDLITAKREIFGQFISGEELYYPGKIVRPCIDHNRELLDLVYNPSMMAAARVLQWFPDTIAIHIGVDMAGRGNHRTAVVVFAELSSGGLHMVYHEDWGRMKYNNQYKEIERIADCFKNTSWGAPRLYVDTTGTQDANVDSLEALGLDVIGINFSIPTKSNMAKILFEFFMRGRGDDSDVNNIIEPQQKFSLMFEEDMLKQILTVRADYKGEGGHLGDWVAAIWCAVSSLGDLSEAGAVEYDYDGGNKSDAVNVNALF